MASKRAAVAQWRTAIHRRDFFEAQDISPGKAVRGVDSKRQLLEFPGAGASDTSAMNVMPGATSVVLSIGSKLAPCQAVPNVMTSGGLPS
jgi:hypothetical protein